MSMLFSKSARAAPKARATARKVSQGRAESERQRDPNFTAAMPFPPSPSINEVMNAR